MVWVRICILSKVDNYDYVEYLFKWENTTNINDNRLGVGSDNFCKNKL